MLLLVVTKMTNGLCCLYNKMRRSPKRGVLRCVGMYVSRRKMLKQETVAGTAFRERTAEQENFFYMNAACQAMILFGSKMRFVLAYICSLTIITANSRITVVM